MAIPQIEIIKVCTSTINLLHQISKQTFIETFTDGNTKENLDKYVDEKFNMENLLSELNTDGSEFYIALFNNSAIGYLKLNSGPAQTEPMKDKSIEIERIYVLKEYYGKKFGQFLFDFSLEIAQNKKMDYIWLGVWEKNTQAIRFYIKNGFTEFNKHIFQLGDDKQTDLLMRLDMKYSATIN